MSLAFALLLSGALHAAPPPEPGPDRTADAVQAESAIGHFNRGNAYRQRFLRARTLDEAPATGRTAGDDELAIAAYTAAIGLDPDFAAAYVNRAAMHYERGDYARAIADCDAAIRIDPSLAEAFNNRSLAYYKSNDYAAAKADFDQTIRLNQYYGNAMIVRALPDIAKTRAEDG